MLSNAFRWWVVALLAALTLLIEAPIIVLPYYLGDEYQGINIAPHGNDQLYYLSRAKAVLDGRPLGQAFMSDVGDVPDSFFSDVEYVYMVPLRVLGLAPHINVSTLYNVLNTIGVFLMLVLIYLLMFLLARDRLLAAAAAIFGIGGYFWVEYGTVLHMLLAGKPIFHSAFNIFGRSTDPYTALVPFFGFLILTYLALGRTLPWPRKEDLWEYRYVAGAGILFGVLFYDYFYAWTFALAFLGSLTLTAFAWRKWNAAIQAVLICAIGVLIGAYQVYGLFSFYTSEMGRQVQFFLLAEHGRIFIESTTGIATLALFVAYFFLRRNDENNYFILALILAGWVALEQQLITGKIVQYGHYYWYFVVPISILVAVYMSVRLIEKYSPYFAGLACVLLIAGAFVNTSGSQYKAFLANSYEPRRQQDFAPIMKTLNELPDSVILGDPGGMSTYIMPNVFTSHTSFFNYSGVANAFPMERMHEALMLYLYLNRDTRADPVAYLETQLSTPQVNIYTDMYETLEAFDAGIPLQRYSKTPAPHTAPDILAARENFLPQFGNDYREFTSGSKKVRTFLLDRGVRYVLWDSRVYPEWDPLVLAPLEVVATSTDVTLYSLQ